MYWIEEKGNSLVREVKMKRAKNKQKKEKEIQNGGQRKQTHRKTSTQQWKQTPSSGEKRHLT